MQNVYKEDCPLYSTVKHLHLAVELCWGRRFLEDEPRSGQSMEVTFEENISAEEWSIKEDLSMIVREIYSEHNRVGLLMVDQIIREHVNMSKCACWVSRMLIPEM